VILVLLCIIFPEDKFGETNQRKENTKEFKSTYSVSYQEASVSPSSNELDAAKAGIEKNLLFYHSDLDAPEKEKKLQEQTKPFLVQRDENSRKAVMKTHLQPTRAIFGSCQ